MTTRTARRETTAESAHLQGELAGDERKGDQQEGGGDQGRGTRERAASCNEAASVASGKGGEGSGLVGEAESSGSADIRSRTIDGAALRARGSASGSRSRAGGAHPGGDIPAVDGPRTHAGAGAETTQYDGTGTSTSGNSASSGVGARCGTATRSGQSDSIAASWESASTVSVVGAGHGD